MIRTTAEKLIPLLVMAITAITYALNGKKNLINIIMENNPLVSLLKLRSINSRLLLYATMLSRRFFLTLINKYKLIEWNITPMK